MNFYLDILGKFTFLLFFIYSLLTIFILEVSLRQAFKQIGEGNATREQRLTIFYRIYKKETTHKKLQENKNFMLFCRTIRLFRLLFLVFILIFLAIGFGKALV